MIIAIFIYAIAMVLANLSVAHFGAWVSPINSFFFIGLDLTLRDWLQVKIKPLSMLFLIVCTGAITYLLNPTASHIAIASSIAFTASALVDWAAFTKLKGSWISRANKSNVFGAAVDSVLFPTIAFGVLMPHIIFFQFLAKVAGGACWSLLITKFIITKGTK